MAPPWRVREEGWGAIKEPEMGGPSMMGGKDVHMAYVYIRGGLSMLLGHNDILMQVSCVSGFSAINLLK